jgi:hypothetical protein
VTLVLAPAARQYLLPDRAEAGHTDPDRPKHRDAMREISKRND